VSTSPRALPGVEHRWVDAAGLRTHVALAGPDDGDAVVLLHGWPQHWWLWRDVLPALAAAGHRAIAVDLRAHGWTDAPPEGYEKEQLASDVLAALDALGVDDFSVAGHDWGGWVAQLLALRAPGRVRRMAVLNIPPVWGDVRRTLPHAWRLGHIALNATPVLGAAWQRTGLMRKALLGVPPADRDVYAERWREPARARGAQLLYRTALLRELPALGRYRGQRLTAPLLVLHGKDDPVIRPQLVEGFRDHADDVRIEWVDGAGHFVVDEQPSLVRDRLAAWFSG
jgi:pimeloyl-ACP methyl ester carboxylesterase